MRKVIFISTILFAGVMMSSCVKNSSEYKALQAQKDSLERANALNSAEMTQLLDLFNEVEENFRSIKDAENYLNVQSGAPGELTPSTRDRIKTDMQFVAETLEKNRVKIADLEKRLKSSSIKTTQLSATLKNLQAELEEKTNALASLKDELAKKDRQIAELTTNVTHLSDDVQTLKTQTDEQQEKIRQQQTELNTVYYCYGTSSELKEQKILVKNQLGTVFNKEYFIREKDFHKLLVIPLSAKSGKLISKHPEGTYEFTKDINGKAELKILDPKNFWSLTKYLVIEVKV